MIKRGEKRAIREQSFETTEGLATTAKQIITDNTQRLNSFMSGSSNESGEEVIETISSFPGQETIVIAITTKQPEAYLFGFLPGWAKTAKDGKANYNCRCETILEKPTWKKAFTHAQRCLVPATAFYETDRATKKRYRFTVKEEPAIFFAGIFNHWTDKETGEILKTYAIITCEANALVNTVWERMPVILNNNARNSWMNIESSVDECVSLLNPYPAYLMECNEAPPLQRKKKSDNNFFLDL